MVDLPRTLLGRTGLEVTTLGFGAMELRGPARGVPAGSDAEAERVLNAVLDAGINFIDTSPDYGLSEERIGKYIAHRRGEYYLASKCGCAVSEGAAGEHVLTAANVRAGVAALAAVEARSGRRSLQRRTVAIARSPNSKRNGTSMRPVWDTASRQQRSDLASEGRRAPVDDEGAWNRQGRALLAQPQYVPPPAYRVDQSGVVVRL